MVEKNYNEMEQSNEDCKVVFVGEAREKCLKDIRKRIVKALYVFEESEQNETFNYRIYVHSLMLYLLSSNELLDFELTSVIVLLNSILQNDFEKPQFKKTILEAKNIIDYLLRG